MDQEAKAKLYRQMAAECARSASAVPEPRLKESYLDLQQRWLQLAEEAEQLEERRRTAGE
jgi:hypothetical protein